MTSISDTVAAAEVGAAPKAKVRNAALDRSRTFLTLVVLLHHAVIPYTYFGHTDPKSWIGFDCVVLATDSFFMAMFFFLSGLFVWTGIARKGIQKYFLDRLLRLGLAFRDLRSHDHSARLLRDLAAPASRREFFRLLVEDSHRWTVAERADLVSLGVVCVRPCCDASVSALAQSARPINRLSLRGHDHPAKFFLVMLAVTAALYIPRRVYWGAGNWFEFGPFSVQHGRVLLYATYFFFGAGIGLIDLDRGLLAADSQLAKRAGVWTIPAVIPYCLMWVMIFIKREILENPARLPDWYEAIYGLFFAAFSVAIMFTILSFFLKFKKSGFSILDPMQPDASACSWCTTRSCSGFSTGCSTSTYRRSPRQ